MHYEITLQIVRRGEKRNDCIKEGVQVELLNKVRSSSTKKERRKEFARRGVQKRKIRLSPVVRSPRLLVVRRTLKESHGAVH